MGLASDFIISELAVDDRHWRIDWFGAVSYSARFRRSSQPLIEVQLSQVPESIQVSEELFEGRQTRWPHTKQIRLPVGLLPLLKIGDFWQAGRTVQGPAYAKENFADVLISRDCKVIKAGLPDDESGSYYIPLDVHPYHLNYTQSYCVQIPFGNTIILVPCVELLRFYFGSSSNLLARLFDAPFEPSNLWSQIGTDHDGIKIDLALGISGRSAADIGRIALSTDARFAAELIGASCIAATARGERAYPKTLFPFSGETCISATGTWLPKDGNSRGVFLVFSLLSCSHPFPFSKLRYTSGRHHDTARVSPLSAKAGHKKMLKVKPLKIRIETKVICDVEPSRHLRSRGIGMIFGSMQFPDLARKPVSRVDEEDVPSISATTDGMSIVNGFSVGEGGSSRGIHPIDLQTLSESDAATLKTLEADLVTVQLFIALLRELSESTNFEKVGIVRMNSRQRKSYLSLIPQVSTMDGEVLESCIITSKVATGITTRSRRVSAAMISNPTASTYIFVMEQQNAEIDIVVLHDISRAVEGRNELLVAFAEQLLKQVDQDAVLSFPSLRLLTLKIPINFCEDLASVVRWVIENIVDLLKSDLHAVHRRMCKENPIADNLSYLQ